MSLLLLLALEAKRCEPKVAFDATSGALVNSKGAHRGVIPTMRAAFYPTYTYQSQQQQQQQQPPSMNGDLQPTNTMLSGTVSAQRLSGTVEEKKKHENALHVARLRGIALGTLVDKQLADAVETMRRNPGMSITMFLSARKRRHAAGYKGLHDRTYRILRCLATLRWHPLACQLPVSSTTKRVATLVDLLCYDTVRQRYVIVETKSGFARDYDVSSHFMEKPLSHVTQSTHNQHQLQLLATMVLFAHTFQLSSAATAELRAAVLRVDDTCVQSYPLQKWGEQARPHIQSLLL